MKCLPFTIWGIHTLHIYRPLEKSQAKAFWKRLMSRYMKKTSNSVIPFHQEMWSPTISLESKGGFHHASFWASATIKKLTASSPCLWNTWVKKPAKDADTLRPPCSKKPKFPRDTQRAKAMWRERKEQGSPRFPTREWRRHLKRGPSVSRSPSEHQVGQIRTTQWHPSWIPDP